MSMTDDHLQLIRIFSDARTKWTITHLLDEVDFVAAHCFCKDSKFRCSRMALAAPASETSRRQILAIKTEPGNRTCQPPAEEVRIRHQSAGAAAGPIRR